MLAWALMPTAGDGNSLRPNLDQMAPELAEFVAARFTAGYSFLSGHPPLDGTAACERLSILA